MKNTAKTAGKTTPVETTPTVETPPPPVEATAETEGTVPVLCRFYRAELDEMKATTGANADATAVACFCRKNLRKKVQ